MNQHEPATHHAILVVDVEKFSDRRNNHQLGVRDGLYEILEDAFAESNVQWSECTHEDRGDGVLVLVPAHVPKVRLVDQLPQRLVAGLRRYNDTRAPQAQMRLRLALNAGEVHHDEHGAAGIAVNLTFRLVEADEVRAALAASAGALAVIVSDDWYHDVVEQDPAAEAGAYEQVHCTVKRARFDGWIRLPDRTGPAGGGRALPASAEPPVGPQQTVQPRFHPLRPLVDVLEGMPALRELGGRRLCVELLARRLGAVLSIADQSAIRHHLYDIARICEEYPSGLLALAEVLEDLESDQDAVLRLYTVVTELSALELVSAPARQRLFQLLGTEEWPSATDAYRVAGGPYTPDIRPGYHDPRELFSKLERLNARADGLPAPLIFVLRLADRAQRPVAEALRRWTWEQAELMGVAEQLRVVAGAPPARPAGVTDQDEPTAYLVIRLQRDNFEPQRLLLRHWRQLGPGWQPQPGDEFGGTLGEIQRQVAKLIAEAESGWAADAGVIRLEFVLPQDLLGLPVDRWARGVNEAVPQILGLRYQLVVRSLDRMRTRDWHRDWRRRWRDLQTQLGQSLPQADRTLWARCADAQEIRGLDASLELDEKLLSVLFSEPLPAVLPQDGDPRLVALRAGIPVMVWCRADGHSADFGSAADEIFSEGFDLVRENMRKLRGEAVRSAAPERHVGSHITLLWDDPDRIVEHTVAPSAPQPGQGVVVT
ncbi:MAG TPA: hypothetical protein VHW44_06240 [Pseudonocardiaceae bacterium]|jgi:hypothetical protein|nr:hypothetical protein [Pseudonocardiaceae bacterium]